MQDEPLENPNEPYDFTPVINELFKGNFSRITVSLTKELLFRVYYEAQPNKETKTDFELAQELGLKPSQVRNLRYRYKQNTIEVEPSFAEIILKNPATCSSDGRWVFVHIRSLYDLEWAKNYLVNDENTYAEASIASESIKIPSVQYIGILCEECIKDEELKSKVNEYLKKLCDSNPEFGKLLKGNGKIGKFLQAVRDNPSMLLEYGKPFIEFVKEIVSSLPQPFPD